MMCHVSQIPSFENDGCVLAGVGVGGRVGGLKYYVYTNEWISD